MRNIHPLRAPDFHMTQGISPIAAGLESASARFFPPVASAWSYPASGNPSRSSARSTLISTA